MSSVPDQSAIRGPLAPISTHRKADAPNNDNTNSAHNIEILSSKTKIGSPRLCLTNPPSSRAGWKAFNRSEMRDGSLHKEDLMPKAITAITTDDWNDNFNHSTSNQKILETLSLASYEVRANLPRLSLKNVEGEAVLFFEELHLLSIRQLQLKLLGMSRNSEKQISNGDVQNTVLEQASGDKLHEVLHRYRQALDDFHSFQDRSQRCPSQLSKLDGLATYLKTQGISIFCLNEDHANETQKALQSSLSIFSATLVQFFFAAVGGLALIVPMLIMVFVPGRTSSVVTTCVSVFIFATALAVWSSVAHFLERSDHIVSRIAQLIGLRFGGFEPKDIVLITATYAAVLMVFVGANS